MARAVETNADLAIDLNADLGEGAGDDAAILDVVTSASIACGGHRGDAASMREAVALAHARGVVVGAHPSYVDVEGFGRRRLDVPADVLLAQLLAQVRALAAAAGAVGSSVRFLKAHGALYNAAMVDDGVAAVVLDAAEQALPAPLPVLGLPGSVLERSARERGVDFVAEAFADRASAPDGTLLARSEPGAVLTDPVEVAARAPGLAARARTVCVHGDSPSALVLARAARAGLEAGGLVVRAFLRA
ncbi:5-oxoprolinase subunit PxpA [Serinibacter arcticus]|uniref:5-oxoprolinase subunit PxpA n=1 Tax=Serinibacter arcticus TaxID=1655435 RepID=UPI001EFF1B07|nr:5-oxoprolinase subunit PxpA [Serinibacter arcticus]